MSLKMLDIFSTPTFFHGAFILPFLALIPCFILFHGVFILSFLALISYFIAKTFRDNDRIHRPPLPPGPKPYPVVGSLITMLRNKPSYKWINEVMRDMNTHILCVRIGNVHVIPVTSPKLAREFLKKQDAIFVSRPDTMSSRVTSGGYLGAVLTPFGNQWKKMRKIAASEILSPAKHKWLHDKRVEEADNLVWYVFNKCGRPSSGGQVNVRIAAQHYCGNVVRKLVFGKRFFGTGTKDGGPGVEEVEHLDALFTALTYLYAFCVSDYLPWLRKASFFVNEHFPMFRGILDFDGHEKIVYAANAGIQKYHDPEVEERTQQWASGTRKQEEDLLDVLIGLKDDGGNAVLTTQETKSMVAELVLATVDNPSNAVEWAMAEMLNQPHMLLKACEELDGVVGRDRLVEESDLPKLNYIKACAKEGFRLHPIAPFNLPHVSIEDTEVNGYFIPKGSHVLLSRPGLGRSPEAWKDPLRFDPERHLKEGEVVLTDHELRMISFSTGRRGCPGITLGSTVTEISPPLTEMLIARLLQAFTWEIPPEVGTKIDLSESHEDLFLANPLVAVAKTRLPEHLYTALENC